jgi:hypothetical protein
VIFLSYASQDAEPSQKICESLRAADNEVWFDQSELRDTSCPIGLARVASEHEKSARN